MNELLRIGAVIKPHGIRGEVKVWPTTDDPGRFDELSEVILKKGSTESTVPVISVKHFKKIPSSAIAYTVWTALGWSNVKNCTSVKIEVIFCSAVTAGRYSVS